MTEAVYILGGYQTDFARNWKKENRGIDDLIDETLSGAFASVPVEPGEVEVVHIGNFASELYCNQGHLGAFVPQRQPALSGIPTARHEAACASGSIALLMAAAEIEARRYQLALVLGIEQMKTVSPAIGGDYLGTAAWYEKEAKGVEFPFPKLFAQLGDEYDRRYGLRDEYLARIAEINFTNAKNNPLAQTRDWFSDHTPRESLDGGKYVAPVGGRLKLRDCSQVSDGAVGLFLCSETFARAYARRTGQDQAALPRILGWGHRTAPIEFATKLKESRDNPYILPHTRQSILDAFQRARIPNVWSVQGIETHDCFTTSEYMAIDHFGITAPGESWRAVEQGIIEPAGKMPINTSGGLIGCGHPVGATGTRQALDACRQVTGDAGEYQIPGAERIATLNIGGSGSTSVALIIGR